MISKKTYLLVLAFASCILVACDTPEYSFTEEDLTLIDSLYRSSIDSIDRKVALMCDSLYATDFNNLADSLKEVRKNEIFSIIAQ